MNIKSTLKPSEIDEIILFGTRHYALIGNSFHPKGEYRFLQINELCTYLISYSDGIFMLNELDVYSGNIEQVLSDKNILSFSIFDALSASFEKSTDVFITVGKRTSSIKYCSNRYVFFDSHSKDSSGIPVDGGTGVVIIFDEIKILSIYLQMTAPTNAFFEVAAVEVVVVDFTPMEKADKDVRQWEQCQNGVGITSSAGAVEDDEVTGAECAIAEEKNAGTEDAMELEEVRLSPPRRDVEGIYGARREESTKGVLEHIDVRQGTTRRNGTYVERTEDASEREEVRPSPPKRDVEGIYGAGREELTRRVLKHIEISQGTTRQDVEGIYAAGREELMKRVLEHIEVRQDTTRRNGAHVAVTVDASEQEEVEKDTTRLGGVPAEEEGILQSLYNSLYSYVCSYLW